MITFETQQDFETAVMNAIRFRSRLEVQVGTGMFGPALGVGVTVTLVDTERDLTLASCSDDSSTTLEVME